MEAVDLPIPIHRQPHRPLVSFQQSFQQLVEEKIQKNQNKQHLYLKWRLLPEELLELPEWQQQEEEREDMAVLVEEQQEKRK